MFGITTEARTIIRVSESKVIGKVIPPSLESKISTLAQFKLLALVPATVQLMICVVPDEWDTVTLFFANQL
jgi:hypothetical protein